MKITLSEILLVVALLGVLCFAVSKTAHAWLEYQTQRSWPTFANFGAGTHKNAVTRNADAVLAFVNTGADVAGYLVKEGVTAGSTIALIAAVSDKPAFIALDGADAIGDPVACGLLNATNFTRKMIAAGAITAGSAVFSNGDGTVTGVPTVAGTYWEVGQARTAAGGAADILEVETCMPCKVMVVTATGAGSAAAIVTALLLITGPSKVMFI